MARKSGYCPYCKGTHYSKKAFNACKKKNAKWKWTKEGQLVEGKK